MNDKKIKHKISRCKTTFLKELISSVLALFKLLYDIQESYIKHRPAVLLLFHLSVSLALPVHPAIRLSVHRTVGLLACLPVLFVLFFINIIVDHACAMFNRKYRSIMRIDSLSCKHFEHKCPWSYNSTDAFQCKYVK